MIKVSEKGICHLKLLYGGEVKELEDLTQKQIRDGIEVCKEMIDKLIDTLNSGKEGEVKDEN